MFPMMMYPATCELCGHWLPEHEASCPRNGVHPSQWQLSTQEEEEEMTRNDMLDSL